MTARKLDFAIVGGGLSGGLIALALRQARPDVSVALIEAGDELGGNHRWSWFASDLDRDGEALLAPLRTVRWNSGYDVRFDGFSRHLATGYRSLASADFAACLHRELTPGSIRLRREVVELDARGVTLAGGETIAARAVIDCRGIAAPPGLACGWQVFLGRRLRLATPHGLAGPTIMDATVDQPGAYRFVYVLPLSSHELFVEDTYYADSPVLDRAALSRRIDAYCAAKGWQGEPIDHETGVLPVVTGGDFAAFQAALRVDGVAMAGTRGGFFHPLTSYSLPFAVAVARAVEVDADLPGNQLASLLESRARTHWRATGFYRLLGRMLFGAGRPDQRARVFAHFYRLSPGVIERFYAGRSTLADRARILCGRPPVPLAGAMRVLARGSASPSAVAA